MPFMPKALTPAVRSLVAFLLVVGSGFLLQVVPTWSHVVEWLNYFLFRGAGWTLLCAALAVSVLRAFLLKSKPRFLACYLLYVFFYLTIFRSRWFPFGAHPTYLFIVLFLHVAALFLLLGLDPTWQTLRKAYDHPRLMRMRHPTFLCLGSVFLMGLFQNAIAPSLVYEWHAFLHRHLYGWMLLVPAASGLLRVRYFGRPAEYAQGLVVSALAVMGILYLAPHSGALFTPVFFPLFLALWVHAYLEACLDILGKMTRPLHRTGIPARLTPWLKPKAITSTGQTPVIPLTESLSTRLRNWRQRLKGPSVEAASAWKRYRKFVRPLAYALAVLAALAWATPKIYQRFFITVVEFSPSGQVGDRTVIRITFSEPIQVAGHDLSKVDCFQTSPPLSGAYRQEGEKTIVFVPSEPLKPSSRYHVAFDPKNITATHKRLQRRAATDFHTEYFKVIDAKLFYSYDLVTNEERQLVGELNFNFPVSMEELRKTIRVIKGKDQPIPVEIEKAHAPTRFYFKTSNIQREKDEQVMTVHLAKGMHCIGGNVGLEEAYGKTLVLPSKVKLEVAELKLWHEPGNTFVTVLFNMPISDHQVRSHIQVAPPVPFKVETEYCYAVLRGDFKPNVSYTVALSKGLIAKSGETLETDYKGSVTIEDLPSKVEFAYRGNILALSGPKTLAVKTVNLDTVHVEIRKAFRNNLLQFLHHERYAPMSQEIYHGRLDIEGGQINEEMTHYINLEKFHNAPYKGLFTITLRDPRSYSDRDWAWFLCTDLGLIAKHSGHDLIVYVLSVETLSPQVGATVQLYGDNNQVIDKQLTDGSGKAVFVNWRQNEFHFNPHFLVAQKEDDFSFLYFDRTALNQHQFAVGGDAYGREGMEAFLTPERGVYRPGEKAYVTVVVRNADNTVPPQLPVRLVVRDPRGAEYQRIEQSYNPNGVMTFSIPFAGDALTGHYDLQLSRIDKPESLGSTSFKVEEFIPDKLKVEVLAPKEAVTSGQPLAFKVKSRQMFGPPASGSKVVTTVRFLAHDFAPPAFKDYTFADSSRQFEEETNELGEDKLDKQGEKEYSVETPHAAPPSALKAYLYAEVYDSGGRPVSAAGFADIHLYNHYLGLKLTNKETIHTKQKVACQYLAIDPQGRLQNVDKVHLVIKRKGWYSIFRQGTWGRSNYQSSPYEELIDHKEMTVQGKGSFEFTPEQAGEYAIILASPNGMRTGIHFDVLGLGYETTSLESPEKLKIVLDKEAYEIGDQVRALIQAPFTGKLILTVEREKVYETRIIPLERRETAVSLPVETKYLPNMYVVGLLVRAPDENRKTLPMVSFGMATINVKNTSKRIGMAWEVPKTVQSSEGMDVSLHVAGDPERTDVVLAAVDQGILQITNFVTPNPLDYFYRKRGLTTQTYSIFDLVLPNLNAQKFALGGDEGARFSRRHLNPIAAKKKKSLALYSGLLKPNSSGDIHYHFDTKGFNGEVRLMALAVNGDRYGASEKAIQIADPIVLIPNFPRFVGPLDQFQIPIEVYNKTGMSGPFATHIKTTNLLKIVGPAEQTTTLDKDDQKRILFYTEAANNAGVAPINVTAQGGGFHSTHEEELSVRPATHLVTRVESGELAPGQTVPLQVPSGFIPYGQEVRLTLSNNPIVKYLRSLDYLIRYPYGCAEQIVSRIFPLIYFKSLGFATGRFGDKANAVDLFVQEGIHSLEKLQLPNGQFTMWPGGQTATPWLTWYISHALIEAKNMGYTVSPLALDRLQANIQRGSVTPQNEGRLDRRTHNQNTPMDPYLLYLKALIGQPDLESMAFLRVNQLKQLSESDRALLSMAYSRSGDRQTAEQILTPDFKSRFLYREQYGSYNSPIRNTAMYLSALVQANPSSPKIFQIVDYLGQQLKNGHFGNTQEDMWSFLALAQIFKAVGTAVKTEIRIQGQLYKTVDGQEETIQDNTLSGKRLTFKNTGAQKSFYYLMAEGTPLEKSRQSESSGLTIERAMYDKSGKPANLSSVRQGDLLVVTLTVRPKDKAIHNLVVVDLLPAGLEIENPRLRSRGQLEYEPRYDFSPSYQDIRDDRILLFSDSLADERHFSYTVRAVTPGRFTVPNAYAEAMYDPDIHGESFEPRPLVIVDNNAQP